ncbi:hypothetical protein ACWJJH_18540 [Endozoicomonadaceae bacterium StTr2]
MHFFFDFDETVVWHKENKLSETQKQHASSQAFTKEVRIEGEGYSDDFCIVEKSQTCPLYQHQHRQFFQARHEHKQSYQLTIVTRSSKPAEEILEILQFFFGPFFDDVTVFNRSMLAGRSKYSFICSYTNVFFKQTLTLVDNQIRELNSARWNMMWTINPASPGYDELLQSMAHCMLSGSSLADLFQSRLHGQLRGEDTN